MIRSLITLLFSAAFAAQASGQPNSLDPVFERSHFDQWLGEPDTARIRWTASVARAELSFHQRLMAKVEVKVDGRDLEARRADGRLVFFVQITGRDGARYQDHGSIELDKLDAQIRSANLEYSQSAFVLPGDFRLAVAILDTATGEHGSRQLQFRVAPPQRDFLSDAWRGLPPVEFIASEEPPDGWYLPQIHGRLQWGASVHSPARVNVILNVAPSVPEPGSRRTHGGELAALLPTLKAISSLSGHMEVLDLARRRSVFRQDGRQDLDWPRLKAALGDANTASIDIHSLSERHHDAHFFVSQVRGILRASEQSCVLIVLTPPVAFESGEDLEPVSREGLPACRVIYIRYRAPLEPPVRSLNQSMAGRRRVPRTGPMIRGLPPQEISDQLEATLKPLSPKVFDVETPEQMSRALAEIEKAVR